MKSKKTQSLNLFQINRVITPTHKILIVDNQDFAFIVKFYKSILTPFV